MTVLQAALLGSSAAFWLPGLFCLFRIPRCPPVSESSGSQRRRRKVSVIVPAYNEERRIGTLLQSLARQSRPADEVLVVDDRSTDATAAIARRLGARVRRAPARPPGWVGKSWACWVGARLSAGDLLVFLDADVRLAPDGLARLLAAYGRRGGLVSVQPYHETPRAVERMSAVCNAVVIGSLGAFTPLGGRLAAGGSFGPCLVVSRADYRRRGRVPVPRLRRPAVLGVPAHRQLRAPGRDLFPAASRLLPRRVRTLRLAHPPRRHHLARALPGGTDHPRRRPASRQGCAKTATLEPAMNATLFGPVARRGRS
jgi:glycosyltransferase involved in cell wall biosynthesis